MRGHGKAFCRIGDMWTRANFVVAAGIGIYDDSEDEDNSGLDDDDDDSGEASQTRKTRDKPAGYNIWIASYEKLKKIYPDLERDLASNKKKYATKTKIETLVSAAAIHQSPCGYPLPHFPPNSSRLLRHFLVKLFTPKYIDFLIRTAVFTASITI